MGRERDQEDSVFLKGVALSCGQANVSSGAEYKLPMGWEKILEGNKITLNHIKRVILFIILSQSFF